MPSTTYTVTSLADVDPGGASTSGTLRHVINLANTNHTGTAAAPDLIQFSTAGGTIAVNSVNGGALALASNEVAVVDATTATTYNGTPVITLDGTLAGLGADGLTVSGGSSTVKGFDIVHFSGNGLRLDSNGGDTVLANFIGVTATNVVAANGANGIFIDGTPGNVIGGAGAGDANVVSGNNADGILLDGPNASDNLVVANFIGVDATGTLGLGNALNGVRITNGARRNTIGGNTPTAAAFTGKPMDGNVISGNGANGVLLTDGAGFNTLSGNFIGTDLAGTRALGNALDGVAILNGADDNSLIGTTFPQPPFVYLNLISGNGGNGLRIADSNNTTIQANCFGLGDDNSTALGNRLDGVLIEGTSANTQFGGVIPLGNISCANGKNGVEIAGTASGTVVFNTFCGLPAFVDAAVGNALDGMLITSTGGDNLLRTNVISGNHANGVHISGDASGVQVAEDIIGMDTNGQMPLPNAGDGVLIDGSAHGNVIGGLQVSVITQNTISANGGNGVAIVGDAYGNQVFHSFIGANILGLLPFGNAGAGVLIGGSAHGNVIGGVGAFYQNVISGNLSGGIQLIGASQGSQVIGNFIGTDRNGQQALGNQGDGIWIVSSGNQIGGSSAGAGNVIAFNSQNGVVVDAGTGDGILGNSVFGNVAAGILLVNGGNLNQPAPLLTQAYQPAAGAIQITGVLAAAADTTYVVEIFASSSAVPAGQGQTLLDSLTVTSDGDGFAPFVFGAALPASAGGSFTATATDPLNNTSAFSAAVAPGGDANSLFVASVYGLLLHRAPDPGASGWVNALNSGASPSSIVLGIESSLEYLTDQVAVLYHRYLRRAPDSAASGWVNLLMNGGTLTQVAEGLVGSLEFSQEQGGAAPGFVLGLYQDVLGRSPSAAEQNAWVAVLNAGTSRAAVTAGFLASTEYHTDLVESDYSLYLGRPAEATGLAGWVGALQAGATDQAVADAILGSPEGFSRWS